VADPRRPRGELTKAGGFGEKKSRMSIIAFRRAVMARAKRWWKHRQIERLKNGLGFVQ
jgi:hypothetical protein